MSNLYTLIYGVDLSVIAHISDFDFTTLTTLRLCMTSMNCHDYFSVVHFILPAGISHSLHYIVHAALIVILSDILLICYIVRDQSNPSLSKHTGIQICYHMKFREIEEINTYCMAVKGKTPIYRQAG